MRFTLLLLAVTCLSMCSSWAGEPISLRAIWAPTHPVLDGAIDDTIWNELPTAHAFEWDDKPAKAKTSAWLSCDKDYFYAAFRCVASEDSQQVVNRQDGTPVWQDESVELILAPGDAPDSSQLYHFVVNSGGWKTFLRYEETVVSDSWSAAVHKTSDGYSVEIRIPFAMFVDARPNEPAWRIVFCRNSRQFNESSSFPSVGTRFSNFWRYARLLDPKEHKSFASNAKYLKPLSGSAQPHDLKPLRQVQQVAIAKPLIIPEPIQADFTNAKFLLNSKTRIVIGEKASTTDKNAARILADWIEQKLSTRPEIVTEHQTPADSNNVIIVGDRDSNQMAATVLHEIPSPAADKSNCKEGYLISVKDNLVVVSGHDPDGTFWGCQTLAQMIQTENNTVFLRGGTVVDRPKMHFRSVHLLTARDTLQFQSKLIRQVLSPLNINYVILQMDKFNWESHPEIVDSDNHVNAADLKKLIAYAKSYNITYIPLVMSLGHMEWIFRGGANVDIAEDPQHPYAYCPLNEKSYKLMFDLFDEAFELFGKPSLFHIGHDEFDMEGQFPTHEQCKALGKIELYYRDTKRLAEYLRKKGTRVMMWGDILLKPDFVTRLDELPKDIIIADWHYTTKEDYPSINIFKSHGFTTIGCPWYDIRNIYFFSQYASTHGAWGMMQTTWSGWQTADVVLKQWPEQMNQYISGAAWAWSPGAPILDSLPYDAGEEFRRRWGESADNSVVFPKLHPGEMFSVDLSPYVNVRATSTRRQPGWLGLPPGEDFSTLPSGVQRMGSVTYRLLRSRGTPDALLLRGPLITKEFPWSVQDIMIGSLVKQIWFLQTTAFPDGPGQPIGAYIFHYADGKSARLNLVYGENSTSWKDSQPAIGSEIAWRGKTRNGAGIKLRAICWDNPSPEKPVRSIDFVAEKGSQAAPVLFAITGIR